MFGKHKKAVLTKIQNLLVPQSASRDEIGSLFCTGEGLEIGAGLRPTNLARGTIVHYADKRTPEELRTYFASNDVVDVDNLSSFNGRKFDFVIAHHVLEHSANVIQTLVDWISLLKSGGVLYLSVPNRNLTPDAARLLTPPTHFLLDYVYQVTEDDFESREHICSFLWGWIDIGGLQDKTKLQSAECVASALNSEVNDLHWHTFNFDTFHFVVDMAAIFSGYKAKVLFSQNGFHNQSEHRIVCKLVKNNRKKSEKINKILGIRKSIRNAIYDVVLENMEGTATYSLSKENKGKIFVIENGKIRYVKSPCTLDEKGLKGIDYTYLELSVMEANILDENIPTQIPERRDAIISRLNGMEKELGIELSPRAVPIIEKDSFNVIYVDKFDHANNSDSYLQGQPVPSDFLLGEKLIDEVLDHNKYSYLVANHVIEHVPDFIQFFVSAANILKDGARIVMYLPDKRYTFDVLRSVSTADDIEIAHKQRLRNPSRSMAQDVYTKSDFKAKAQQLWDKSYLPEPTHSIAEALRIYRDLDLLKADIHCFTFTPESFRALIDHVKAKYVPDLEVLEITETPYGQYEFIVDLILKK